jgi:hypothetical protein
MFFSLKIDQIGPMGRGPRHGIQEHVRGDGPNAHILPDLHDERHLLTLIVY